MTVAVAPQEVFTQKMPEIKRYFDEKEMDMTDIYEKLRIGQEQIDRGETVDGDEVFAALRKKYGLYLDDVYKVISYAAFLKHLEDAEDAEDIAYIEAHKDEPTIPLEQALGELGL